MAIPSPLKLKLSDEIESDVERYIIDVTRAAVEDNEQRNADLYRWRDVKRGFPVNQGEEIWPGSCRTEDGLCQEQYSQLLGPLMAPLKQFPLVRVTQSNAASSERAQGLETWLAQVWRKEKFLDAFRPYVADAEYYPTGFLCVEWRETKRKRRGYRMWDGKSMVNNSPMLLSPNEAIDPNVVYQQLPVLEVDKTLQGRHFRCVEPWKLFPYPADAPTIERCVAIAEEMDYTDTDLLNGIEDYGFDKEKVKYTLANGYSDGDDDTEGEERNRRNFGLEAAEHAKNFRCYLWYGYLPKLCDEEGEPRLPSHLWNDLFCAVVSLDAETVLKLEFCPYSSYPYHEGSILPEHGSIYGLGLALLLDSEQQEATHWRRVASNNADLATSPMTIMTPEARERNKSQGWFPGGVLIEEIPNSIRPYQMQNSGAVISTQMLDYTLNRAQAKAANKGYGQVNPKQPLVAEMEGVLAATDVKFDLYQYNVYSILIWAAEKTLEYELQFNPTFRTTLNLEDGEVDLSAEDLAEEYEFSVAQLNQNASQDAKIQKDVAISHLVDRYFGFVQQTTGTPFQSFQVQMWKQTRDSLNHLDVPNPKDYIGEMPQMSQPGMLPGMGQPGGEDLSSVLQTLLHSPEGGAAGSPALSPTMEELGNPQGQLGVQGNGAGMMNMGGMGGAAANGNFR